MLTQMPPILKFAYFAATDRAPALADYLRCADVANASRTLVSVVRFLPTQCLIKMSATDDWRGWLWLSREFIAGAGASRLSASAYPHQRHFDIAMPDMKCSSAHC